jgi:hypothetical protein
VPATPFDFSRCSSAAQALPQLPSILGRVLLGDCSIPTAPGPIFQVSSAELALLSLSTSSGSYNNYSGYGGYGGYGGHGSQGPRGAPGSNGSQGTLGLQGYVGEYGPRGSQGAQGSYGPPGLSGPNLLKGQIAFTGPYGIPQRNDYLGYSIPGYALVRSYIPAPNPYGGTQPILMDSGVDIGAFNISAEISPFVFIELKWIQDHTFVDVVCDCSNSSVSPPAPPAMILGCACGSIPATLHMSATGPCDGVFQPCVLQYGPTPSNLSGLNLGANSFLSTTAFTDDFSGVDYLYNLECDTIFFRLSRVYLPSTSSGAFHDASIYSWSIGQPGNTCSPFLLSTGYIYSGGNSNCVVTIS